MAELKLFSSLESLSLGWYNHSDWWKSHFLSVILLNLRLLLADYMKSEICLILGYLPVTIHRFCLRFGIPKRQGRGVRIEVAGGCPRSHPIEIHPGR